MKNALCSGLQNQEKESGVNHQTELKFSVFQVLVPIKDKLEESMKESGRKELGGWVRFRNEGIGGGEVELDLCRRAVLIGLDSPIMIELVFFFPLSMWSRKQHAVVTNKQLVSPSKKSSKL